MTVKEKTTSSSVTGLLLSLLVIPIGVALWVVLWSYGFMASLVAFGIAYGAVWLFRLGAKRQPSRSEAFGLLAIILLGVVLSFVGGMVSDGWQAWSQELGESAVFLSEDFWSFVTAYLSDSEVWNAYMTDMLIALVFAVLGAGGMVKDLFMPAEAEKTVAKS